MHENFTDSLQIEWLSNKDISQYSIIGDANKLKQGVAPIQSQ